MDARHGTVGWDEVMVFETDEDVATCEALWSEITAAETDVVQRMQQAEERRVAAVEKLK